MRVVVGLGNPGEKYKETRHNLGFEVINGFLKNKNIDLNSFENKHKSQIFRFEGNIFCKPQTFMNLSGESVFDIKKFYKLENSDFLIIYDDLNIPIGKFKFSFKKNSGGHNGIKDIINKLGGNDFLTLRIGIRPQNFSGMSISDYVLDNFCSEDKLKIAEIFFFVFESIDNFLSGWKIQDLQNKFN